MRTIWEQKWFAIPAILLVVAAVAFVYLEGPRTYESSQAFALANPKIPSDKEIEADPSLLDLNSDNPYLRSSDPNLVANVVITRLNAAETADRLGALGVTTEYTVSSGALGGGLVVSIVASGDTPAEATSAVDTLGTLLEEYLHEVQTINGADERYLFTSIVVSQASKPVEKLSSRLRTVVVVGIAGTAVIFGAVSLGTWLSNRRARKQMAAARPRNGAAFEASPEPRDEGATSPRPKSRYDARADGRVSAASVSSTTSDWSSQATLTSRQAKRAEP
jgi:hypothetical protein